ncbi:CHAT domain-containing protein [Lysobacter maris]|uniref:CHAT domain-containing protein n=1 Tax=Marilutibacter maris TaxID=1605891 RepID=A0A508AW58_9GAMM|nr:caspase family protein [Lysobacter maris]KAB8195638.1 CHAT domain-containing protein [Lysobacter maris]
MRIALIVGINYYEHGGALFGCVDDAHAVKTVLERHGDGAVNFDCKLLTGTGSTDRVDRTDLKDHVVELFKSQAEIALFYFAGHGHIEAAGGYLLATDSRRGDEGLSLSEVLRLANASPARNKVVVLDSCHSGIAGTLPETGNVAALAEGLTVLTASTDDQYATEEHGKGVFTTLLVDALHGGAANLTGDITPGSVYAHIDQSLGAWEQRPVFKTNVREFVSLRKIPPLIDLEDLRRITEFFPAPGAEFRLDPTFEPELKGRDPDMPAPVAENTRKFAILQRYSRLNLVVPVDAPHMWHAAMQGKACKLTVLGEHYRRLVEKRRI